MLESWQGYALVALIVCVAAAELVVRVYCRRLAARPARMSPSPSLPAIADSSDGLATLASQDKLRPAELAYLVRQGDTSHALIVLVVDLLHRAVKSAPGEADRLALAPYEVRVWQNVRDYARRWVDDKVGSLVPDPRTKTAAELAQSVSRLYNFVTKNLRPFLKDVFADPRNLRRYFAPAGLVRLLADLGTSGYREAVERELLADLVGRGLVADDACRQRAARGLFAGSVSGLVISVIATFLILGNPALVVCAWLTGFLGAVMISFAFRAGGFIPFLPELKDVVKHVNRQSWRLSMLKIILNAVSGISIAAMVLTILAAVGMQLLVLQLVFKLVLDYAIAVMMITCGLSTVFLDLFWEARGYALKAQPSSLGIRLISESRASLAHVSPFDSFKQVLAAPDYDPQFANVLALYGVETLVILA